jgi:hypothetical protein
MMIAGVDLKSGEFRMRIYFPIAACLVLTSLSGCEVPKLDTPERKPVTLPGMLPVGEDLSTLSKPATPAGAPANAAPAPPPPADNKGIIGKMTAVVVDAKEALKNPNIKQVDNKVGGTDPLTVAASAYVSIRSKASTLGFQQELQHYKALNERNPTYAEFTDIMKRNKIEFTELYPYQMYGYDAETGAIVVLEDTAEKARRYKEAGLDPNTP